MVDLPIQINVLIFKGEKFKPYITLRRKIKEQNLMHKIVKAAIEGQPLIILPHFPDKYRAIERLREAGIIYYDTDKKQWLLNTLK